MSKRSYIVGFASGLFLAVLVAVAGRLIWVQTRPTGMTEGGGRHLNSPSGDYEAEAWNMQQRSISGRERKFYSFRVTDNNTGFEVCRHEIPMPEDPIWFRGGAGSIDWNEDSSVVRFGSPHEVVWSFTIPKSKH
jgi:hypothetical protein